MVETEEEQRSMQRWQRLQRAAATEDLVVPGAELESWPDPAAQHADVDADEELEISRKDPTVRGWRWLKAVSMVVFTARPNKTTTTTVKYLLPFPSLSPLLVIVLLAPSGFILCGDVASLDQQLNLNRI